MGVWENFIHSDFQKRSLNMLSFPARMLMDVTIVIFVVNLIVFYWHEHLLLSLVLAASSVEVIAIAVNFAFWVPQYQLKW
jgi:hypothetical protein